MTREQATKASLALKKVDDFRMFIDEIDILIDECDVHDFRSKLMSFLDEELERREEVLRNL
jgi:hypothetical protein